MPSGWQSVIMRLLLNGATGRPVRSKVHCRGTCVGGVTVYGLMVREASRLARQTRRNVLAAHSLGRLGLGAKCR